MINFNIVFFCEPTRCCAPDGFGVGFTNIPDCQCKKEETMEPVKEYVLYGFSYFWNGSLRSWTILINLGESSAGIWGFTSIVSYCFTWSQLHLVNPDNTAHGASTSDACGLNLPITKTRHRGPHENIQNPEMPKEKKASPTSYLTFKGMDLQHAHVYVYIMQQACIYVVYVSMYSLHK